jgi:hypothetical protein
LNPASASPFSEKLVQPAKETLQEAASASKDFVKDKFAILKNKTSETFARITGKVNDLVRKDLETDQFIAHEVFIPGHEDKSFVCQGITYLPASVAEDPASQLKNRTYRIALLSYYPKTDYTDLPAQIVAVDMFSGKAIARFSLYLDKNKAYKGHAGGITAVGKYLWVASGYAIHAFSLKSIISFVNLARKAKTVSNFPVKSLVLPGAKLFSAISWPVDSKASYLSFDGKFLWVGDFTKDSNKSYAPIRHHQSNPWKKPTWISGYRVDKTGFPTSRVKYSYKDGSATRAAYKPDRVICCRESVQGMAVFKDHIALSISYGAANSKLAIYRSPMANSAKGRTIKFGEKIAIEAFVLGEKEGNWLKTVALPAGSEDLEFDGRFLYVTFEGSSANYRNRWLLQNPKITISENFYLINPGKLLKD